MDKLFIRFTKPTVPTTMEGYSFAGIIYYNVPMLGEALKEADPVKYTRKTIFMARFNLAEYVDLKDLPRLIPNFTQDLKDLAKKAIQDAQFEE